MKNLFVCVVIISYTLLNLQTVFAQGHQLKIANRLYEQFNYQQAIDIYKNILKKDKKNAEASEKLAHCYRLTSNTRRAEFAYKKAIRYNKSKNILKFYYAQALMSNKKYDNALQAFETYTELSPKDSRGWRFLESCQNINEYLKDSSMYKIMNMSINSRESDFSPAFYKDGLVFTSARVSNTYNRKNRSKWTGEAYTNMYFSNSKDGRKWSKPINLEGKKTNPYHEGPAVFNKRGNVMYFTRNVSKGKKTGLVNLRLFETRLLHNEWQDERELPFNSGNYSVGHPALSADGHTLYFASDMPGGYGGKDIYESTLINGQWTRPRNLGKNVNTEGDEMFPFAHEDGTIYYASDGLGGFGGLDIFSAQRKGKSWNVVNVGYPINSARDDFGLILNQDKQTGYLASNRKGSKGDDIYMLYIKQEKAAEMVAVAPLKPNKITKNTVSHTKKKAAKNPMVAQVATKPAVVPKARKQKKAKSVQKPAKTETATLPKPVVKPQPKLPSYTETPFEAADRPNKIAKDIAKAKVNPPSVSPAKQFEAADRPTKKPSVASLPKTHKKNAVLPASKTVYESATQAAKSYDSAPKTTKSYDSAPKTTNIVTAMTPTPKAVVTATNATKPIVKKAISPPPTSVKPTPYNMATTKPAYTKPATKHSTVVQPSPAIVHTEPINKYANAAIEKPIDTYEQPPISSSSSFRTTTIIQPTPAPMPQHSEPGIYDSAPSISEADAPIIEAAPAPIVGASPAPVAPVAPSTPTIVGSGNTSYSAGGGGFSKKDKNKKDLRLVLIGIVLDKSSKKPIGGASVELLDLMTQQKQSFITETDGNFYFKLEPERNYMLSKIINGQTEEQKEISTLHKLNTEILHAILDGGNIQELSNVVSSGNTSKGFYVYEDIAPPQSNEWTVDRSKMTTGVPSDAYSDPYDDSHLTFKIQIGAFKRSMQTKGFFAKVEGEVEVERAANGFNRYVTGNFRNYKDADGYQKDLFRKGYNKSFVAAYLNGYRLEMPVEQVLEMYYNQ